MYFSFTKCGQFCLENDTGSRLGEGSVLSWPDIDIDPVHTNSSSQTNDSPSAAQSMYTHSQNVYTTEIEIQLSTL